jgi:DNA-directed RNA polymerase specialized sigma24 family protein
LLESEELREENESNAEDRQRLQREIDQLQRRIDKLQADHTGMLARGKQRYEAICQGGTTVQWTRDDFVNYMEYYKMLDLAFVNELRSGYDRLSPKYMFFAAMEHQGKTDEDIMRIMGVSESTLRSTRSRIRSKCREG